MNIADLVVLLVIAFFAFLGYRRGLLMGIYAAGAYLIAILLGFALRKPVASVINMTPFPEKIHDNIYARLVEYNSEKAGEGMVKTKEYIEGLNFPALIENFLKKNIGNIKVEGVFSAIAEEISDKVTALIVSIFAFLITVVIVLILLLVIKSIIKKAKKLPVIKQFDHMGGVLLGVVEGVLVISVAVLIVFLFSSRENVQPVVRSIEDSLIARFFFEKNFLALILSKLKLLVIMFF